MPVVIDKTGKGRHTDVSPLPIKQEEKTMKIRMKENKKGSPDGVQVLDYQKGKTYDLPDRLAGVFVKQGWAVAVKPQKPPEPEDEEPLETKVIEPEETKDEELEEPIIEEPPESEKKKKK